MENKMFDEFMKMGTSLRFLSKDDEDDKCFFVDGKLATWKGLRLGLFFPVSDTKIGTFKMRLDLTEDQMKELVMKIRGNVRAVPLFYLMNHLEDTEGNFLDTDIKDLPFDARLGLSINPMWCIKIKGSNFHGATAILDKCWMHKLAEKLDDNLYIWISAVDELLSVPVSKADKDTLLETIHDVNRNVLEPGEMVTDRLFIYNRKTGDFDDAE